MIGRVMFTVAALMAPVTSRAGENSQDAIPSDCAMLRNERPRVLFCKADIPQIRKRCQTVFRDDLPRWRAWVDGRLAKKERVHGITLGVLYHATGDRRYAEAAKQNLGNVSGMYGYAATFDMIAETMRPEEIARHSAAARKWIEGAKWGHVKSILWLGAAFHGTSGDDFFAKAVERRLRSFLHTDRPFYESTTLPGVNFWARGRGGNREHSFNYQGNHMTIWLHPTLITCENALGLDLWERCNWTKYLARLWVYRFCPHKKGVVHAGLEPTAPDMIRDGGFQTGGPFIPLHAAKYKDGLAQWWSEHTYFKVDPKLTGWPRTSKENYIWDHYWGKVLWHDPDVPIMGPEKFPPAALFPGNGYMVMRSDWTKDATFAYFQCGDGIRRARQDADNLAFIIHKKGSLAVDTGCHHPVRTMVLKMQPTEIPAGPGRQYYHVHNYGALTIANNSIVIRGPKGKGERYPGGGQVKTLAAMAAVGEKFKLPKWHRGEGGAYFDGADFPAYETNPVYDYGCGDATRSYHVGQAEQVVRQFVYLRPDHFVVFDRVVSAEPRFEKAWIIHALDRPKVDGKEMPDRSVHPDGHFLWEGETATITDEKMQGRLFVRFLLPRDRIVRLIGGRGHEFETEGVNRGPSPETYRLSARAVAESRRMTEGLCGWRIEVVPAAKRTHDVFLHVMQACDKAVAKMTPVELIEQDGRPGARIKAGRRKYEVTFNASGNLGGRVKVTDGGKVILDRELATTVEDHYRGWRDDPSYKDWMTSPFTRTVVGEREQDDYRAMQGARPKAARPARSGAGAPRAPEGKGAAAGERKAASLYRSARQAERAGLKDLARRLYERIARDYPSSAVAEAAKNRL